MSIDNFVGRRAVVTSANNRWEGHITYVPNEDYYYVTLDDGRELVVYPDDVFSEPDE